ncbi:MAG: 2-succinyl-5-enolpyruvyl-6-hydroxy-3-cyclohexene-1-carboxylic-acid synthase, partial [Myxococcota bacterium]|nr:2-succinyl-5-enolpyruvyl-6-hydroxy-3-cyclohexene-1-carboxylic-acid synthase [Myxococcota bacterium]
MTDANPNALWARCIIEELVRSGVRDVCISPGSRSTPLTLAAASEERLRVHNHIDERSAAFFALGCAKITGQPSVLICTSGSAGAHYHPAIIEALYARVPLIALTADRPVELVGTGAGQTIVQQNMYGPHVLLEHHLEIPSLDGQSLRRLRFKIDQAAATAKGSIGARAPGPVHINVPFREPLEPTPVEMPEALEQQAPLGLHGRRDAPFIEHVSPRTLAHPEHIAAVIDACQMSKRGVIVCGPHELIHGELRRGLLALAAATGFPLLADPVSSLRYGEGSEAIIARHDALLRSKKWRASHAPDLVLRFGAQPTSKAYRFWREEHPEATEILIDPYGDVFDQPQQAAMVIAAHPGELAQKAAAALSPRESTAWAKSFHKAESIADDCLRKALEGDLFWEGWIAHKLVEHLPAEGMLWCASSMPIRDVDAFAPRREEPLHVLASRGANGIDGLISSALGAASALAA